MQDNHDDNPSRFATRPRLARTRFVELNPARQATGVQATPGELHVEQKGNRASETGKITQKQTALPFRRGAKAPREPLAISTQNQSTSHLMQLSGMIRPPRKPGTTLPLGLPEGEEDGYWPLGIQQIGPLPIAHLYGRGPFGRTLPTAVPLVMPETTSQPTAQKESFWKGLLLSPVFKIVLGLLSGISLLLLVWPFINLSQVLQTAGSHLNLAPAILAGIVYLSAHTLRGLRWKLFLGSRSKFSWLRVMQLSHTATLLNFLLPLNTGEAAKILVLKRLARVPFNQSLPTIAQDKTFDLVVSLLIISVTPVLGVQMNPQLWLVFSVASVLLFLLILLTCLAARHRPLAFHLLQKTFTSFPKTISHRIESFIAGIIDALLASLIHPTVFLSALLLTSLAAVCNGLFFIFAFQIIGFPLPLSSALLGYAIYTLFFIVPTPPGQLGSNEIVGLLIFGGLLHLPGNDIIAMAIFSHLWIALIIISMGMVSLKSLDLTIVSALQVPEEK